MTSASIRLPQRKDLASVLEFARDVEYYSARDDLEIDFGDETFFPPFSILFIATKLKRIKSRNPSMNITLKNHRRQEYLTHMGFFNLFSPTFGQMISEFGGGENYLALTCLKRDSLYETPTDKYHEFQDLIQRHADRLARLIARNNDYNKDMFDALSYSIRETMRNVFEHSKTDSLYYCAQYWPRSNKVEFAVADFGIGIRHALAQNPNFRFDTDKQAIEYSLLPSVSGSTHLPRRSEHWFNSGYGLYMTNRLARNGGNFVLASGTSAVLLSSKTKTNFTTSYPGTILRFNIDVNKIGDVQARLARFREEGFAIAKTIAGSGNRPPSAMSLLLRRDYS
jgi:hypothetical protein